MKWLIVGLLLVLCGLAGWIVGAGARAEGMRSPSAQDRRGEFNRIEEVSEAQALMDWCVQVNQLMREQGMSGAENASIKLRWALEGRPSLDPSGRNGYWPEWPALERPGKAVDCQRTFGGLILGLGVDSRPNMARHLICMESDESMTTQEQLWRPYARCDR